MNKSQGAKSPATPATAAFASTRTWARSKNHTSVHHHAAEITGSCPRAQQTEAAKLDAAIAKNLKDLGFWEGTP